jgi:hypothetical protein
MSQKRRRLEEAKATQAGSHQQLAEEFLAKLERSWRRHGGKVFRKLAAERPEVLFKAIANLIIIQHRRLPEPPGFDRRRNRADAFERLQERTASSYHGNPWTKP